MKLLLRCVVVAAGLLAGPVGASTPLQGAGQVVVVTPATWDSPQGRLQAFERTDGGDWQPHGKPIEVALGRSGSAWGIGLHPADAGGDSRAGAVVGPRKREGDGRSPAGVFALGTAFGYAAQADTRLPWQPMRESSYCMDVPDSPYYNRIVDAETVGAEAVEGSTEPMRLDLHNQGDVRYQQGFVIQHNPRSLAGQGSCIFAHLWRRPGEATAGCTAMTAADMQNLLGWLDADRNPLFVLLPRADHARLQADWQLPALDSAAATDGSAR